MSVGTVKWYNEKKGYGFLVPDVAGDDVFFHVSALKKIGVQTAAEGDRFEYTLSKDGGSGKVSAANLKAI